MAIEVSRKVIRTLVDYGAARSIDDMDDEEFWITRDNDDFDLVLIHHAESDNRVTAALWVDAFSHRMYATLEHGSRWFEMPKS